MLPDLIAVVAPVFITIAVGYGWIKSGQDFPEAFVTRFVALVTSPCLVFSALTSADISPNALAEIAGAMAACYACLCFAGWAALKMFGLSRQIYLPALMFPNIGNMGLPICYYAFGEEGLALAVAILATSIGAMWTVGAWISSGTFSLRKVLLNPALIAIAIAVAMTVAGAKPPKWIANTTDLIGDASIPLMLLTLGVSLGRLSAENLPRSFSLGGFRLAIGFAAGLGVATLFGLEGAAWGVLIIQASMPAAVFNFLFAHLYDQRPDEVAGVIVASSLLSLVTAPLVVAYVLANAG